MRFVPALAALSVILAAPAAHAACDAVVSGASSEAQMGSGLASSTVRSLLESCGEEGPAQVIDALVSVGSCDQAAQLGRSLSGYPGMSTALSRADACLAEQVAYSLDDLVYAAEESEREQSRYEDSDAAAWDANEPRDYQNKDSLDGGLLGRSQSGYGTGSERMGDLGTRGRGGARTSAPDRAARKYKAPQGAATGMGRYTPSPDDRMAEASPIAAGSDVAWSTLSFRVWFDFDSATLRPEAVATLQALADHLETYGDGSVLEVVGHTDSVGSWWYNNDLSVRRARSVRRALQSDGVPAHYLTIRGVGESEPSHSNGNEWGRARNRRVEFRFYRPVVSRHITR